MKTITVIAAMLIATPAVSNGLKEVLKYKRDQKVVHSGIQYWVSAHKKGENRILVQLTNRAALKLTKAKKGNEFAVAGEPAPKNVIGAANTYLSAKGCSISDTYVIGRGATSFGYTC